MEETAGAGITESGYEKALAAERKTYDECLEVHDLPPIFHYWTSKHIQPKLKPFGFDSANDMFEMFLKRKCEASGTRIKKFISLGSGNCDLEIGLARQLSGSEFLFECCDLNAVMLERGRVSAGALGLGDSLRFVQCDLNSWQPDDEYDVVLANQSLHHIVNLEGVFAEVKRSLRPDGSFLISDMIGRNGHQRWPEALAIVHEFWRKLPPSYRFNRVFRQYEEMFQDWDCSLEGFEGVRSEDILRLLLEYFHFDLFVPFGNVIDPFVDRSFGFNFDSNGAWDRCFIDQVHQRDEQEIAAGRLTPTHLVAVAGNNASRASIYPGRLSPEFCLRKPVIAGHPRMEAGPYLWNEIPQDRQEELELACNRLAEMGTLLRERTRWARQRDAELEERTTWALKLETELRESIAWARSLEAQLTERTTWTMQMRRDLDRCRAVCTELQDQLARRTDWALRLQGELEEQTTWALRLEEQWKEKCAWSERLRSDFEEQANARITAEQELASCVRNPIRLLFRIVKGLRNRLRKVIR